MALKNIIECQDTKTGFYLDVFIQILIILSLVTFSVETLPGLSTHTIGLLNQFELISVMIFTIEYLL